MTFLRRSLVLLAVAALVFFTDSASANILLNPGFENGSGADVADWTEFTGASGSTGRSSLSPHSGGFHAYMELDHINNPPAGAAYFVEQVLPVGSIDNSLNYDLSFFAKTDSTDFTGMDIFYQILWLDQDGSDGGGVKGQSLTQLVPAGINTSYQSFGLSDIDVPDGTDSVLVRFQLSGGAVANIVNGLYIDDAVLRPTIPEPASLALLMTSGLLALAQRRRK